MPAGRRTVTRSTIEGPNQDKSFVSCVHHRVLHMLKPEHTASSTPVAGYRWQNIDNYFHILDHCEYIFPGSVMRLLPVVWLTFKMLTFLSYLVIQRKESTMAKVHDLSTSFQIYTIKVIKTMCACIISFVCLT